MLPRVLLLLLAAAPAAAQTAGARDQGALQPGSPREVALDPDAAHTWSVAVQSGRSYHVEVEQLGTYLELRFAAGTDVRRANDRPGRTGREEAFWVAEAPAAVTMTVGNLAARPGRYRIALSERAATDEDRERDRAERDAHSSQVPARLAAAARFGALGLVHRQVRTLDRASYRAVAVGDAPTGRAAAEQCLALAPAGEQDELRSSCLLALANAVERTGALDQAAAHYAQAIEIRERLGDPLPLAHALADSGRVLVLQGDYERSDGLRRRAHALALEAGDEYTEAATSMAIATVEAYRGRLEDLLAASERVREVGRRRGSREMESIGGMNAGIAYGNLGDVTRSIARIREALAVAESAGLKETVAQGRFALGAAHEDAGDLAAAQRELEAGVAVARGMEAPELLAIGETHLGWILARRGRPAEAEGHLRDAAGAARRAGARMEEATADMYLGKALLLAGRAADGAVALERALAAFRESNRVTDEAFAILALAGVSQAQGDLAGAAARADEAIAAYESVRARVALADQRARYAAFRREAYDLAVEVAVARDRREPGRGHLDRAYALTERARARALLEEIAERRAGRGAVPPELSAAHRRTLDRLGHVQRELVALHTSAAPHAAERERLERALAEAVAAEEIARANVREHGSAGRAAPGAPPSATELARGLAADEAVALYHVADARSWLFVVARDGLAVHELPGAGALRGQVDALRALLSAPRTLGSAAYAAAGRRLFDALLAPVVAGRPQVRRLRVVPDGPLWEIPFEALVSGPGGRRFADLPYVLRRFTVSYQASASARTGEVTSATGTPELVAFADPLPSERPAAGEALARLERAVFREGERWALPRLACAEREAREVAALFGAGASRVLVGAAARESVAKSDPGVGRARYLLFATHALLSETMPSQSALVMSLAGDGDEDGLLQAHEVDGMALDAELVVLSACETALGDNVRGEGLLGLARAFFHAGARRLVVSQWKLADCGAADVSIELFRLLRGQAAPDPADALRRAKLRLLERPQHAHPYYWAPFVLVG